MTDSVNCVAFCDPVSLGMSRFGCLSEARAIAAWRSAFLGGWLRRATGFLATAGFTGAAAGGLGSGRDRGAGLLDIRRRRPTADCRWCRRPSRRPAAPASGRRRSDGSLRRCRGSASRSSGFRDTGMSSMNSSTGHTGPFGQPAPHGALAGVVAGERQVQIAELAHLVRQIRRAHSDIRFGIGQQPRRIRSARACAHRPAPSAA